MERSATKDLGITGGDWTLERDGSLVMAGQVIGVGVDGLGPDDASRNEKAANARLLSAAPDLYEAMAMLIDAAEARDFGAEAAAMEAGRAALAKARGR